MPRCADSLRLRSQHRDRSIVILICHRASEVIDVRRGQEGRSRSARPTNTCSWARRESPALLAEFETRAVGSVSLPRLSGLKSQPMQRYESCKGGRF